MLIGNKSDLEDKRVISLERGQEVAKHHGIPFVETSAKANVNIKRAFDDITMRILEKMPEKPSDTSANYSPRGPGSLPVGQSTNSSSYMKPSCC